MYQALYRKWRPKTFTEVRGQDHITKTLRSQTESGRFSHAYLFTGSRGTGKTTCAKLLARAVNCLEPKNGDPCNACESCKTILDGSAPDISEIDAASYSGVDNIRLLREELVYSPVQLRQRVYIIDEVHMLSTGAFNALLKTLEEPPSHVLFILATTELHKVPVTIVSRCQRFAFRRIPPAEIKGRLWHIAESEGAAVAPEALAILSRMADGALRDGINLLDQCLSLSEGQVVDLPLVQRVLGLSGLERTADWLEAIARSELQQSLSVLEESYQAGRDWASLLDELGSLMRDILLGQMLENFSETRLPAERAENLNALWPRAKLLAALDTLIDTQGRMASCANKRLETELCILRLCGLSPEREKLARDIPFINPAPKTAQKTAKESSLLSATDTPPKPDSAALSTQPESPEREIGSLEWHEKQISSVTVPPAAENAVHMEADIIPPAKEEALPEEGTPPPASGEPEQSRPSATDTQEGVILPADPRWRALLEEANPFLGSFLPGMSPECQNGALVLRPNDGFEEGLLDAEFAALVAARFPGGLRLALSGEPAAPVASDLDSLADRFEDLVSFE